MAPFQSNEQGFRNKAKMVVSGSVERPILGILKIMIHKVRLICVIVLFILHIFQQFFSILKDFIGRAGLVPYNIAKQKGELKYILLTESIATEKLMLRFVLRTENKLPLIRRELPKLLKNYRT